MKRTGFVIGFVLLYMLAMLKPIAPVLDYIINYDYISEVLCINKAKPEQTCNGKCYLKLQLQEEQEKEQERTTAISFEDYPLALIDAFTEDIDFLLVKKHSFPQLFTKELRFSATLLRPPIA